MNLSTVITTTRETVSRLKNTASMPLYKNGLALVTSLMATSGLGIVYWALAARYYTTETVGINSAIISTMGFLTNVSQFGLVNFLTRYLPRAGKRTTRLILFSYLFSVSVSFLATVIFAMGINIWSPSLELLHEPRMFTWFLLTTMAWCVFALQDGVLTGLRQATWVPIENTLFALTKMGLLVLFSTIFLDYGIFYSWAIPIFVLNILVNIFLFKVFIPKHIRETEADAEYHSIRQMFQFVGGDYLGTIVWMATVNLMPLLVIERLGAEANAYFYFPWMIGYALYMVSRNLGMSLTVESAKDQSRLAEYARRSLSHSTMLLVPIVLVIVIGAPLILEIFGHEYSVEGEALLRYLSLSALPYTVVSLYVSIARVQRKVINIVVVLSFLCVLATGLILLWIDQYGVVSIGWAWLLSQSSVALFLLVTGLRPLLFRRLKAGGIGDHASKN